MYFLLKGANKNVTNEMLSQIKTYNKQLNQLTYQMISVVMMIMSCIHQRFKGLGMFYMFGLFQSLSQPLAYSNNALHPSLKLGWGPFSAVSDFSVIFQWLIFSHPHKWHILHCNLFLISASLKMQFLNETIMHKYGVIAFLISY